MWTVYIILTQKNKLYTGITTDVDRRFNEHLNSNKGAKFFRSDRPIKIVYTQKFQTRSEASKREIEIKKLSRKSKEKLIG